jgi:hypothetical protein
LGTDAGLVNWSVLSGTPPDGDRTSLGGAVPSVAASQWRTSRPSRQAQALLSSNMRAAHGTSHGQCSDIHSTERSSSVHLAVSEAFLGVKSTKNELKTPKGTLQKRLERRPNGASASGQLFIMMCSTASVSAMTDMCCVA